MIVGVPAEVKTDEYRVAMIPVGVEELTRAGHTVLIQGGAGQGSGIPDDQYAQHGAQIVPAAAEVWKRADLIVVSMRAARQTPLYDPVSHLVYTTRGDDVRDTIVNGRVLMRDGKVLSLDADAVLKDARAMAAKVKAAVK